MIRKSFVSKAALISVVSMLVGCHRAAHFPIAPSSSSIVGVSSPEARPPVLTSSDLEELVLVNLSTGSLVRLTYDRCRDNSPCISPDGKYIVFSSGRPAAGPIAGNGPARLFWLDLESGELDPIYQSIIDHLSGAWELPEMTEPAWRPNSNMIAFVMSILDSSRLAVYEPIVDSLYVGPLVCDPYSLCWSSDGRYLAFAGLEADFEANKPVSVKREFGFLDMVTERLTIIDTARRGPTVIDYSPSNSAWLVSFGDSASSMYLVGNYVIAEYGIAAGAYKYLDTLVASDIIGYGQTDKEIIFKRDIADSSQFYNYNVDTKQVKRIGPTVRHMTEMRYFRRNDFFPPNKRLKLTELPGVHD
jgi:Tol biopolymer transport system component